MILTIAIENTNTIVGCFDKETLKFAEEDLEGAMISSVVPSVTDTVKCAASRMTVSG